MFFPFQILGNLYVQNNSFVNIYESTDPEAKKLLEDRIAQEKGFKSLRHMQAKERALFSWDKKRAVYELKAELKKLTQERDNLLKDAVRHKNIDSFKQAKLHLQRIKEIKKEIQTIERM